MNDPDFVRLVLLLMNSFPSASPFWLARLAGRDERQTTAALVELEAQGLALRIHGGLWRLTDEGYAAC
jgi:hypothetical protein